MRNIDPEGRQYQDAVTRAFYGPAPRDLTPDQVQEHRRKITAARHAMNVARMELEERHGPLDGPTLRRYADSITDLVRAYQAPMWGTDYMDPRDAL